MDTPPTKRKAQNRAAQRAFRERRAARVNELEDQMKQMEDDQDMHVAALNEQISNLSHEVETMSKRNVLVARALPRSGEGGFGGEECQGGARQGIPLVFG